MAYLKAPNMVESALASSFTYGTDTVIDLDDVSDFETDGGVVLINDGTEWVLQIYSSVDAPSDELRSLSNADSVYKSSGADSHEFAIGTTVEVVVAAEYVNQIIDDVRNASAGAILYESSDEIGSSSSLTFDGTTLNADCAAVFNETGADVDFRVEGTGQANAFFVQGSDGYVGIGTPSPGSLLDVRAAAGSAGTLTLSTDEPTVEAGNILGRIDFQAPSEISGDDATVVSASILAEAEDTFTSGNNSTGLVFATASYGAVSEAMRIDHTGNVGIGTATPTYPLDISVTASVAHLGLFATGVSQPATAIRAANCFGSIGYYSGTTGGISVTGLSDTDAAAFYFRGIIGSSNPTDTTPAVVFTAGKSNGSTSWTSLGDTETAFQFMNFGTAKVTILGGGNFGIGTTTPNAGAILDVTSTTKGILLPRIDGSASSPANGMIWYDSTANTFKGYENGSVKTFYCT